MIELVIDRRQRSLGGFDVGRVLPYAKRRMIGPFVFLDHMGPLSLPPGIPREMDVRPHPHIGLSTVTYLFEGEMTHRDSVGSEVAIRPGEVNWMTAGRGITHSERFDRLRREGGRLHGIQSWVALPEDQEESEPAFAHHDAADLPALEQQGAWMRLIAGSAFGEKGAVRTHSPLFYVHWRLAAGGRVELPVEYPERAIYIVAGAIELESRHFSEGQMIVLAQGDRPRAQALAPTILLGLGGEPLGPRFIEWNFVSSSVERIAQAKADWRAGRMKLPDLDHDEFVPLPEAPSPPANPMS